jgi:hypothetical protein
MAGPPVAWNCECGEPNSGRVGQPFACKKCGKPWGEQPPQIRASGPDSFPVSTANAVKAQVAELDAIVSTGSDLDLVSERIKRWKKRTAVALRGCGLGSEAEEFEELKLRAIQMGNPEGNLAKRVRLYRSHLLVLAEELEQHPPHVTSDSAPVSDSHPLQSTALNSGAAGREQRGMAELHSLANHLGDTEEWFNRQRESGSYASADSWLRIEKSQSMGRRLLPLIARYTGRPVEFLAGTLEDGLRGPIPNPEWQVFRTLVAQAVGRAGVGTSTARPVPRSTGENVRRDFFICHATEDKAEIARPIADELVSAGRTVWFDEYELIVGDSLRARIDEGLRVSAVAVVVLSHHFFSKDWPQRELDGLVALGKRLLPIWHGVTAQDVASLSPTLAGIYAVKGSVGPARITEELIRALTRTAPEKRASEAQAPIGLGRSISSLGYTGGELSPEAVEILVAAADDGDIARFSSDQSGDWVRAGGRHFSDPADPALAAIYVDALEDLEQRGLVRNESETLYTLTGKGFKLARVLKSGAKGDVY